MITSTGSSQVKRVIQLQKKSKIRKENRQFVRKLGYDSVYQIGRASCRERV